MINHPTCHGAWTASARRAIAQSRCSVSAGARTCHSSTPDRPPPQLTFKRTVMLTGKWTLSNFGKIEGWAGLTISSHIQGYVIRRAHRVAKLTWNPWNGRGRRLPFFHVFDETWRIGWIPLYRIQIGCSWYMFQLKIYSGYTYSILFYDIILKYIKSTFYTFYGSIISYVHFDIIEYHIPYWPSQGALRSQTHWSPAHRTTQHHPPDRVWEDMIDGMIE